MQDVLTQIQSGALVCPQSRQTLAVDAARTRLVTSDGRYSYPLLGETVPILLVDEEAMGEYAAGSARMTAEYAEDKPAPRRSLPLRILRRLVYLRGEPQVSDYRTQASIDACARVLSGQPGDAVCLSVGGGPGRCGDFHQRQPRPVPERRCGRGRPRAALRRRERPRHLLRGGDRAPLRPASGRRGNVPRPETGGMVFAGTPFLYHYHGYPQHYQNFTLQGHENVFRRAGFHVVESGTCVGPVHAIVLSIAVFLAQYCTSPFGRVVSRLWNFSSQYLYPLDKRINTRPNAHILAATTYVLARKEVGQGDG